MAWVFLDCDSTVTTIEGIDELARMAGCHTAAAKLTEAAMAGRLGFQEALAARLDLAKPSQRMVADLGQRYLATRVPGCTEAVARLRAAGHDLAMVTGGLRQAVVPLAAAIGFAAAELHAIELRFDAAGAYAGFATTSPLLADNGKATMCARLAAGAPAVLVGDGMTDAAVREVGIGFIQFAGVVDRPAVAARADARLAGPGMAGLPGLVEATLASLATASHR